MASASSPSPEGPERPASRSPAAWWYRVTGPDGPVPGEKSTLSYYTLLVAVLFLLTIGLIMVFSVQSVILAPQEESAFTLFSRYLLYAAGGLVAMFITSRLPQRWIQLMTFPVLGLGVALQASIFLFPSVRTCGGGNCNWVAVPVLGTVQPSEFIKLGLCLFVGYIAARHTERLSGFKNVALWVLAPAGLAVGAVLLGHDLGTVIILAMLVAGALWMAGLRWPWFAGLGSLGLIVFSGMSMFQPNRRARIMAWLHPEIADPFDAGYQPKHGRWALGTGGWWGVGPGSSRQKWGYLTQADSDYIFAVLGEEFGLAGSLVVIILFAVVGWCCARIIRRSQSLYVAAVTGGIMTWVVGQALVNMSVVVGLLPVLGVPLPLVSHGGSSLVSVLLACGVLLSFARNESGAAEALRSRPSAVSRTLAVISPRRRNRA